MPDTEKFQAQEVYSVHVFTVRALPVHSKKAWVPGRQAQADPGD